MESKNKIALVKAEKKKMPKEYSLNIQVNKKGQLVLPTKSPVDGSSLEYYTDKNVPLIPMIRQLQKTIDHLPVPKENLWDQACSGDKVTNQSWNKTWNDAVKENAKNYDFIKNSCMKFHEQEAYKPVIIAGAGPSLRSNYKYLKEQYSKQKNTYTGKETEQLLGGRKDIKIASCLHNFAFFEDHDIMTEDDWYLNLDSGPITITELSEGGKHKEEWYWNKTKDRVLVTTALANPKLLEKWQGEIYFFKTASSVVKDHAKIVDPTKVPTFSVGGNVLGACLYFAKAILGAGDIIFIGADFCFSHDQKFHAWDSQYDNKFQGVIPTTDIYGNRAYTWPSYYNFKCFFEHVAAGGQGHNPQMFINATEGGHIRGVP